MRDTEKMYATMNPWRLFFIVALPGMVSMFAMSIYSIIEGIFIGQKLGEGAFAAVNIAKCGYMGTALIGLISTSILFFFPKTIASMFANAEDVLLLTEATHGIRLFCFAYLFRWFVVTTQGFLSAIEKPFMATLMSVGTAFVFPVVILGACWNFGLDGIWANFVGVNFLSAILGIILLLKVKKEIKKKRESIL